MTEANRKANEPIPDGLLAALAAEPSPWVGAHRMIVARQHARTRAFDDSVVVEAIASELLLLSA